MISQNAKWSVLLGDIAVLKAEALVHRELCGSVERRLGFVLDGPEVGCFKTRAGVAPGLYHPTKQIAKLQTNDGPKRDRQRKKEFAMINGGILGLTLRTLQVGRAIMYHLIPNVKPHGGPLPKWSVLLDDIMGIVGLKLCGSENAGTYSVLELHKSRKPRLWLSHGNATIFEGAMPSSLSTYNPTKQIAKRSVARANFHDCIFA